MYRRRWNFVRTTMAITAVCIGLWLRPTPLRAAEKQPPQRSSPDTRTPQMTPEKGHDIKGANQTPMLSEEEKERIRAEEIFRDEVRREIEAGRPTPSSAQQLWSLLNSSFALWFLSSIVLGSLTAAIATYQKSHSAHVQRAELRRRLNTEISSRMAEGLIALRLDLKRIENGQVFFASAVYDEALSYLDNKVTSETTALDFSIYPEYRWRSYRSLIFELSGVADRLALSALREAKASHTRLIELTDETALEERSSKKPPDAHVSLSAVEKSIEILQRLQTNSFWQAQL